MRYSFILTAYKATYLHEAIDSILSQKYTDFCLIVVNDCSPHDLSKIVSTYQDNRITYIECPYNTGKKDLIKHWNNCLKYANSEYIILASDDDIFHHKFLEDIHHLTLRHPQCDIFQGRAEYIDRHGRIYAISPPFKELLSPFEFINAFKNEWIISSLQNYVFKTSALKNIGGFINYPLAWHSDDATVLSLSLNGVAISKDAIFTFRNSGSNISSQTENEKSFSLKIQARNKFYNWICKDFSPLIKSLAKTEEENYLILNLNESIKSKLSHLTSSMIHQNSVKIIWECRNDILSSQYMSKAVFYKLLARKVWLNNKYIINPTHWAVWIKRKLKHQLHRRF